MPLQSTPRSSEAIRICETLRGAGFTAYLAGGCVRDALLGREPKDFDVATNATPETVRKIFGHRSTLAFGKAFGVIGVLPPKRRTAAAESEPTEVATFRSDGSYSDGRHPDSVQFGSPEADALRRDFTINGLFYDPFTQAVIDFVGGQADLAAGILRTIGDPEARFSEDKLRMLRAIRFATVLDLPSADAEVAKQKTSPSSQTDAPLRSSVAASRDQEIAFRIDPPTFAAIRCHADSIGAVSGERIGAEMRKMLTAPRAMDGLVALRESGLAAHVFPQLATIDQASARRSLASLSPRRFPAALALVAIATPDATATIRQLANRWKLSGAEQRASEAAIQQWQTLAQAASVPWSRVQPVLTDRDVRTTLSVAKAMVFASRAESAGVELAEAALHWPLDKLAPPPLLTGDDLKRLGIPAGPIYRTILEAVRDRQLDQEIETEHEAELLAKALADDQ